MFGDVPFPAVAPELVVPVLPGVHHVEDSELAPLDGIEITTEKALAMPIGAEPTPATAVSI